MRRRWIHPRIGATRPARAPIPTVKCYTCPDSAGRFRRVEPHWRGGVEPVPRPAFQDRCDNHQPADGCRQIHRLWPSGLLRQVRPGVPSRSNILRRQGDVQWLRNVEARRRIMHSISSHQPCCLRVWTVPESLPIQQTRVVRASDSVVVRHQRATPEEGAHIAGRLIGIRQARDVMEVVVGSRNPRRQGGDAEEDQPARREAKTPAASRSSDAVAPGGKQPASCLKRGRAHQRTSGEGTGI